MPIHLSVEVGQQHQGRMGDEQNFAIERRMLRVLDDICDHPIAVLAVDRTESYVRRQFGEVVNGLLDQVDARLDEKDFLAQ